MKGNKKNGGRKLDKIILATAILEILNQMIILTEKIVDWLKN